MRAWIENLVDKRDLKLNDFSEREQFLEIWAQGPYDLINFNSAQLKKMKIIYRKLMEVEIDHKLTVQPENFIAMCHNGDIDPETFEQYGPILAMRWLHAHQRSANVDQADYDMLQQQILAAGTYIDCAHIGRRT